MGKNHSALLEHPSRLAAKHPFLAEFAKYSGFFGWSLEYPFFQRMSYLYLLLNEIYHG